MSDVVVVSTAAATTVPSDSGNQTLGAMKSDVCTYFGFAGDPTMEAQAGLIIKDVIDDLNRKKLWRFNLYTATDITTVAGTSSYSLTTVAPTLWRLYSARKTDSVDYRLDSMQQSDFDILFSSQSGITGYPYVVAHFNIYRNGTLQLFPTPDGAYTISLRYFRLIGKPSGDSAQFDLPPPYVPVIKYGACARMAALVGHSTLTYWEGLFLRAYNEMNSSDEDMGDEFLRFVNIDEIAAHADTFMNPAARPRMLDFF